MNAPNPTLKAPRLRRETALEDDSPNYWTQLAWLSAGASPLMAWRRAAGCSAAELAALAGVSVEVVLAIEARTRAGSAAEIAALATALGLCPGDLED